MAADPPADVLRREPEGADLQLAAGLGPERCDPGRRLAGLINQY
ncbi:MULTISPECIES: hypothetical protein [unclassified Streptomyces]